MTDATANGGRNGSGGASAGGTPGGSVRAGPGASAGGSLGVSAAGSLGVSAAGSLGASEARSATGSPGGSAAGNRGGSVGGGLRGDPGRDAAPAPAEAGARRADDPSLMAANAAEAAHFLKAIGHQGRLMILCHLATGEKTVTELEELLRARQAAVSQQLARLRLEGLVTPRREGKAIYYSLTDGRVRQLLTLVHHLFCEEPPGPGRP